MGYADGKYGVIERQWFGLTKKHGGDAALGQGYTFGSEDATKVTHVERWYPRGPITIEKFGAKVLASVVAGSPDTDKIPCRLRTRGASASLGGTFNVSPDGGTLAPHTFASIETITYPTVKQGEYISIESGTPQTAGGTAANTATTLGSVAFFIDYKRKYDANW